MTHVSVVDDDMTSETVCPGVPMEALTTYAMLPRKRSAFTSRRGLDETELWPVLACLAKGNWTTAVAESMKAPTSAKRVDDFILKTAMGR